MNIEERVKKIIVDELSVGPEEVTLETRFAEDLGADSLDMTEIVMSIEEVFDIDISDDQQAAVKTFGDAVELVKEFSVPAY